MPAVRRALPAAAPKPTITPEQEVLERIEAKIGFWSEEDRKAILGAAKLAEDELGTKTSKITRTSDGLIDTIETMRKDHTLQITFKRDTTNRITDILPRKLVTKVKQT